MATMIGLDYSKVTKNDTFNQAETKCGIEDRQAHFLKVKTYVDMPK
jgi:hypothetical protein